MWWGPKKHRQNIYDMWSPHPQKLNASGSWSHTHRGPNGGFHPTTSPGPHHKCIHGPTAGESGPIWGPTGEAFNPSTLQPFNRQIDRWAQRLRPLPSPLPQLLLPYANQAESPRWGLHLKWWVSTLNVSSTCACQHPYAVSQHYAVIHKNNSNKNK